MLGVLKKQLARMDLASVVGRSQPRLRGASMCVKHAWTRLKAHRTGTDELASDTPKENQSCVVLFLSEYTDGNADEEEVVAGCVVW